MRIGIDCRLWNETGVGRYTRNLVLELAKIDQKNYYVLFFRKNEFDSVDLPGSNFEKKLADVRWHSIAEQVLFANILNKEKLDLVHFPYFSVPLFYRKPFVITIHDLILNHFPTGKASTLPSVFYWTKHIGYRFVIAQGSQRAKKIIAVSQATKKEIVDHLSIFEKKIEVIYEGVDTQVQSSKLSVRQAPLDQARDKQDKQVQSIDESYFLYVGNAYPHKNLDVLMKAFEEFQQKHASVSLVLVGKEDYFYTLLKEKVKSMNLDIKILFYGYATDEELSSLYAHALSLVFPSKMEGFGLPILEAMANKCLVIASDIPVFREIGQDALLYFDPNNYLELVEKMEDIYRFKNHNDLIKKGIQISKEFSWKKMAEETLKVYNASL